MGGEKVINWVAWGLVQGSPPHGRGKAQSDSSSAGLRGITPAWAGKSNCRFTFFVVWEDHPRVGGEKQLLVVHHKQLRGSPPRGRGKVHRYLRGSWLLGITPAWAGKSKSHCCYPPEPRDHPRVGGEKLRLYSLGRCPVGSPPRGRGKGPPGSGSGKQRGITPAWAGKSNQYIRVETLYQGSPPRGRGKVLY